MCTQHACTICFHLNTQLTFGQTTFVFILTTDEAATITVEQRNTWWLAVLLEYSHPSLFFCLTQSAAQPAKPF